MEEKKKKIGVILAIVYWIAILCIAAIIHSFVTLKITLSKCCIGGEIFLVPVFLLLTYFLYDVLIRKLICKYMYQ